MSEQLDERLAVDRGQSTTGVIYPVLRDPALPNPRASSHSPDTGDMSCPSFVAGNIGCQQSHAVSCFTIFRHFNGADLIVTSTDLFF